MPKMRIYELARELGRENKEVIEFLRGRGADIKSHASSVDETQADDVRKSLGKGESSGDGAKKKKNIIRVVRAQNASDGGKEHAGRKERKTQQNRSAQGRTQGQGGQTRNRQKTSAEAEDAASKSVQTKTADNTVVQSRSQQGQNQ